MFQGSDFFWGSFGFRRGKLASCGRETSNSLRKNIALRGIMFEVQTNELKKMAPLASNSNLKSFPDLRSRGGISHTRPQLPNPAAVGRGWSHWGFEKATVWSA